MLGNCQRYHMNDLIGLPSEKEREYARPERLADVLALISGAGFG